MKDLDHCQIDTALRLAANSPCRSKRGVALFNMRNGAYRGGGNNGPPRGQPCPGREVCAGTCGIRCVHAEIRALREALQTYERYHDLSDIDLIHVELAADGGVVACDGPSCPGCAAQILDAGFVQGVWLYERIGRMEARPEEQVTLARWRRYSAQEFYDITLERVARKP